MRLFKKAFHESCIYRHCRRNYRQHHSDTVHRCSLLISTRCQVTLILINYQPDYNKINYFMTQICCFPPDFLGIFIIYSQKFRYHSSAKQMECNAPNRHGNIFENESEAAKYACEWEEFFYHDIICCLRLAF